MTDAVLKPESNLPTAQAARMSAEPMSSNAGRSGTPLSWAQQQIWVHSQMSPDVPVYNESVCLHLPGSLDVLALERSLNEIVRRHEAWRTTFEVVDGQPVQVVHPSMSLGLRVIDLSALSSAEREPHALRLASEQVRQPFDLAQGPLLRATLVLMNGSERRLFIALHHIMFDGISIHRLFPAELAALYQAFSSGKESPLPDLPVQYKDYARQQRERVEAGATDSQLEYWSQQLSGNLPSLQLPFDRARPLTPSFRGAYRNFVLSAPLSQQLLALSRGANATPFMTLLAAFAALLHRYSGEEDVVIGTVSAGRTARPTEALLGCFCNPIALRLDLSGNPAFRELLARARNVTFDALANSEVPFTAVVQKLRRAEDRARQPLFQVFLSLAPSLPLLPHGWRMAQLEVDNGAAKFDLDLELDWTAEALAGRFNYNTDVFEAATIERMVGHFATLLQGLIEDSDRPVSAQPLLTGGEWEQIVHSWNQTTADYPRDAALHQLFETQAERTPNASAVIHQETLLTFAELNARANRLAHYLRRQGITGETRVGVCLPSSIELMVALLAVLKAGGVCLPLDPKYPRERLDYMLEDAQAPLLLTTQALLPASAHADTTVLFMDQLGEDLAGQTATNPENGARPDDLAYLIYTSGSTGKPRGVLLTHRGLVNHSAAVIKLYGLSASDRTLQFSSLSFDIAIEEIFPTWAAGGAVVLRDEDLALGLLDFMGLVRRQGISVLDLPTAYWHEWVHELVDRQAALPDSLRLVIVGGEKASLAALRRWRKLAGSRVRWINTYGPTEASVIATAYEPGAEADSLSVLPIGRPVANTRIHLLDRNIHPVPVGVAGELHIGGPGVARGYLNRPELTAEKFVADPFTSEPGARLYKTGDLARWLPDGQIEFIGRTDHQVKIRGFRVELGEIEAALMQHPEVSDAVMIVREESGDKRLVAYVVRQQGAASGAADLRSFLKTKLPEYMVPASVVLLQAMPMTPNGKVDRRALPAPEPGPVAALSVAVAPRDELESQLARIWEEVLKFQPISVNQNFFELGGHSLLAVRLM
jgi:surfactin family lipopeptide synthetase A